jgi:hypothetical protein
MQKGGKRQRETRPQKIILKFFFFGGGGGGGRVGWVGKVGRICSFSIRKGIVNIVGTVGSFIIRTSFAIKGAK